MKKIITFAFILLCVAFSFVSLANGGDQRVVNGTYLINLSRAPFTPRVGVKTSMLASFVDIQKDKLIVEDLIVNVRIAKLGGGQGKREFIFRKDNIAVKGGVLELPYIFANSGLHEVFFDFAFISHPEKVYEAPDFLIDIQPKVKESTQEIPLISFGTGVAVGALITWMLAIRRKTKKL